MRPKANFPASDLPTSRSCGDQYLAKSTGVGMCVCVCVRALVHVGAYAHYISACGGQASTLDILLGLISPYALRQGFCF